MSKLEYLLGLMLVVSMFIIAYHINEVDAKPEPLICGLSPKWGLHYVDTYRVDKNYVIDLDNGGMYNVWHCRAYKGEDEK